VADRFEQLAVVELISPLKGGILDRLERLPRAAPMDDLGLEQHDDRLSQSIIVRVSDAADGGLDACLGEALGAKNAHELRSAFGMADKAAAGDRTALVQGLV
jgi:hypothetical protein